MTPAQWQALADEWIEDARALLAASRWGCAYYAAGYAVECALKVCIMKRIVADPGLIIAEGSFQNQVRSHKLETLIVAAGLATGDGRNFQIIGADQALMDKWYIVKDWSEANRYDRQDQAKAEALFAAIADPNGVLPWIKQRWN
jgi:hypothetical protein